jgi:hypothetical protein
VQDLLLLDADLSQLLDHVIEIARRLATHFWGLATVGKISD